MKKYKIKDVAKNLNVNQTAVHNALSRLRKEYDKSGKNIDDHLSMEGRHRLVDEIIYIELSNKLQSKKTSPDFTEDYLISQLQKKDQQIEYLQKLLENQQILTLKTQEQLVLLESTPPQKKKKFWRL